MERAEAEIVEFPQGPTAYLASNSAVEDGQPEMAGGTSHVWEDDEDAERVEKERKEEQRRARRLASAQRELERARRQQRMKPQSPPKSGQSTTYTATLCVQRKHTLKMNAKK